MYLSENRPGEHDLRIQASRRQLAADVVRCLIFLERLQPTTQSDPTVKFPGAVTLQETIQFGRSAQEHLEQPSPTILESIQVTNLLQNIHMKSVRIVDDQRRCPAFLSISEQQLEQ
jgi:hypothetical protein